MKVNNKEIDIVKAMKLAKNEDYIYHRRSNGLKLSDFQINVLNRNNISYLNFNDYKHLLFIIENILSNDYDEELDIVSNQLSELIYYNFTNK